ncbi:tyrosine-protein phosphatase 99A-like isoform X2 [Bacillus rossius redtenbacheri]|uniref:tyrosine-protein phosphatase 99A-like isoform X2 n=1 Tax=Bacillus rossius redtenbacheri TaxID=93214 RepID=UPI002FDDA505
MKSIKDYFVQTKKMKFIVVNISAGVVMCFLLQPHINAEPETIPSQPVNVTVLRATSTTIELSWSEPEHPNGKILGYHLYFIHANTTDVKTVNASGKSEIEYVLSDLKPFTDYTIQLRAFTRNFVGNNSDEVRQKTDVAGPNAPQIVNITCQSHDSLFIQWQRPLEFYNTIDFYYVSYRNENVWDFEEIVIETSKEHLEVMKLLPNLSTNTMYEVKVHGATRSIFNKTVLMHGNASEPRKVMMRENCDKIQIFLQSSANELTAGMIAGFVCILFIILLVVIAFVLWRKCFQAAYYYLDDPPRSLPANFDWMDSTDPKSSIPIHLFSKHVAELHADGDIGFSKEYEAIQAASIYDYSSEHSQHPENKQKNRYLNILAYDHSRVQLLPVPGQKKSLNYVNANYIDGFQCSHAYIGTQGPLPATFDCFWRMVWEQRVAIIVMITNLVERGRRKCDMYWPKEGVETYGVVQVRLVKEDVMATYTVRKLQIRHLRVKKKKSNVAERFVHQYHYTNWPDHGTPDHPLPVLSFVKKSSAANPVGAGPIIVHCSAGVGRTGTYIVLDAMLKQIRSKGEVNIFGFLRHIRTQRNFLVQTEEQYVFIHDALLEAIESGETNISCTHLSRYIQSLQSSDVAVDDNQEPVKLLDRHFKLITSFQLKDFHLISANKPCNRAKNRCSELLAIESTRVNLTPKPGVEGSDYINATWFIGFNKLREFIVTQHPLESTIIDFWQMIWDHNAQTVVMLTVLEEQEYGKFWPEGEDEISTENFKVKFIKESEKSGYVTHIFTVQSIQDDYELSVKIIICSGWPHICSSLSSAFELICLVQEWHLNYQNGPIVVVDRFGGLEAATFCILMTLKKQFDYEQSVDVYMYAKLLHNKRPCIWKTQDDYLLIYRALETLTGSSASVQVSNQAPPDLYVTANGHINGFVGSVNGTGKVCVPVEGVEAATSSQESPA